MRAQILKIVLPVLLAIGLYAVPTVFASGQAAETKEAGHATEAVTAGHGETAAAPDAHAADTHATDAHDADVAGEGHGDAHGGGHAAPMITAEKLKDLFWRTVNFLALVLILVKFLAKPIAGGLSGRRRQVKEELDTLQEKRDEAERSYKEFEGRLAGMEQEMEVVVEKAIAMAQDEKTRILAEAEESADEVKRQAEAAVQAAIADAKAALQDEVAEQAAAMAEELIVKNLTAKDQVAITEQYLERVGAVQ